MQILLQQRYTEEPISENTLQQLTLSEDLDTLAMPLKHHRTDLFYVFFSG